MPCTLHHIRKTHPLLDWVKVREAVGATEDEMNRDSLIGFKGDKDKAKRYTDVLKRYVFVKRGQYVSPIKESDFEGSIADVYVGGDDYAEKENGRERNGNKKAYVGKAKFNVFDRVARWRRSIVGIMIAEGMLDAEDLSKSKLVREYGFSVTKLEKMMEANTTKTSSEIRDDIYNILLLCDIMDIEITFG